jgi:S1-C subfamily serine protease
LEHNKGEKKMNTSLFELSNTLADAAEKAAGSTVLVDARERIPASGIAYTPDLVLTANHVVGREDDLNVLLPDGSQVSASLAGRDPGSDLAVLKLEKALLTPAETTLQARVGQLALALGRPSSAGIEASLGVISAIGGPVRTYFGLLERYYRIDASPYPGFSGGPLVDAEGKVLGINTSGFGPGMFMSIPAAIAWKKADELAKHGSIKHGYLGIRSQVVEISEASQQGLARKQPNGLLIVGIDDGTPAAKSSLLVGDIVVGVGDSPVADHDELFAALSGDVVGQSTPLVVLRGGQPQIVNVVIESRPVERERVHNHRHGHRFPR